MKPFQKERGHTAESQTTTTTTMNKDSEAERQVGLFLFFFLSFFSLHFKMPSVFSSNPHFILSFKMSCVAWVESWGRVQQRSGNNFQFQINLKKNTAGANEGVNITQPFFQLRPCRQKKSKKKKAKKKKSIFASPMFCLSPCQSPAGGVTVTNQWLPRRTAASLKQLSSKPRE